ncbi:MAG: flagellar motor protein MotB [Sphingobium sp.]
MTAAPALLRRNRWAVGFADLLLLLLGFFVLLHAGGPRSDAMLAGVSRQFGGRPMEDAVALRANALFVPGEALLTPDGRARLAGVARRLADGVGGVEVQSHGSDTARQRFDDWDLAAARLGAVARALKEAGPDDRAIVIRGLDQAGAGGGEGQVIRIAPIRTGNR